MTLYSLVLFVHVTAVLALSATLSFEALSLFRLRHASSLSEIQRWMDPVPGLRWIAISSMVFILVSGIYLARQMSALGMAWPKVTIAALLLIGPFGALRSEEHTSELQSHSDLVCRLLLEKKK